MAVTKVSGRNKETRSIITVSLLTGPPSQFGGVAKFSRQLATKFPSICQHSPLPPNTGGHVDDESQFGQSSLTELRRKAEPFGHNPCFYG
jgi:hypothetical protein